MADYILPNGREILSVVLLKLEESALAQLPMACKTCPDALWQTTGKSTSKVSVRCFCPLMHVFTWGPQNTEEILDCEHLYATEEEEPSDDPTELPPYLREQQDSPPEQLHQAQLEIAP